MSRETMSVRQDATNGQNVLLIHNGALVAAIPWQQAEALGKLLIGTARKAEEVAQANKSVAREALLIRSGAPFSLTTNAAIREEAFSEAQWGTAARKGMPLRGRRPSKKKVGAPKIRKWKEQCPATAP